MESYITYPFGVDFLSAQQVIIAWKLILVVACTIVSFLMLGSIACYVCTRV